MRRWSLPASGPRSRPAHYVSFDYFMTISHPNNKAFLESFRAKYGPDALMNTVGVGMYNAAHMAALAIAKAGQVKTDGHARGAQGADLRQGAARAGDDAGQDHQTVVPSYLMKVRDGWTGVNDMFEEVKSVPSVQPKPTRAATYRSSRLRP